MARTVDQQQETSSGSRLGFWIAIAIGVGLFLWLAADVLLLVFAAVLVAIFLRAVSDWLEYRTPLSERSSLVVTVLVLAGAAVATGFVLAPRVAVQVELLSESVPRAMEAWTRSLEQYGWGRWILAQLTTSDSLFAGEGGILEKAGRAFTLTFGAVIDVVLILVVGLFLAAEANRYREGAVRLIPPSRRSRARQVMRACGATLRGWFLGQMISMSFLGVFAFLGLSLLGIPLALTLAVFTALLTFIPNLGPLISVIPPVLLAFAQSPMTALYVLLFYLVLQNVEGNFITPMAQRWVISLPPALLITAQLLLAVLFGFFGLLLAAPLTAAGMVLVRMLYLEDTLGEPA